MSAKIWWGVKALADTSAKNASFFYVLPNEMSTRKYRNLIDISDEAQLLTLESILKSPECGEKLRIRTLVLNSFSIIIT